MKKYKAILFDFDGTLVDTSKFETNYTTQFIKYHKLENINVRTFRKEMRHGTNRTSKELQQRYRRGYSKRQISELNFFQGAIETLVELHKRHIKLGIITTSPKTRVTQIIDGNKISHLFDVIIGKEDVCEPKPSPEPVLKALEILEVQPIEALFIGNNKEDIESGLAVGVDSGFFVENKTYYNSIKDFLESNKVTTIIRDFNELL